MTTTHDMTEPAVSHLVQGPAVDVLQLNHLLDTSQDAGDCLRRVDGDRLHGPIQEVDMTQERLQIAHCLWKTHTNTG